jgi:hypothetical protein
MITRQARVGTVRARLARRLLRSRPPRRPLAWAAARLGGDAVARTWRGSRYRGRCQIGAFAGRLDGANRRGQIGRPCTAITGSGFAVEAAPVGGQADPAAGPLVLDWLSGVVAGLR